MNQTKIKNHLKDIFVPRDSNLDDVVFRMEYMQKESPAYFIYQAISDAQCDSGLSFNFSYTIANLAVDILAELEDWEDEDAITEAVDQAVPIYTSELMEIYQSNSWAVDEARHTFGSVDSEQDAKMAWYEQIRNMVQSIASKLEKINDNVCASGHPQDDDGRCECTNKDGK